MSPLPLKADMFSVEIDVRLVPIADIWLDGGEQRVADGLAENSLIPDPSPDGR